MAEPRDIGDFHRLISRIEVRLDIVGDVESTAKFVEAALGPPG
jgi:hypothetical protein